MDILSIEDVGTEGERVASTVAHRHAIRELLENWIIWRDAGDWDRFATVWHEDARMNATWFESDAADFIAGCKRAFDAGMTGLHSLGGINIELNSTRAFSQTKMQITQRGRIHEIEVDVICEGRFFDALEYRDKRWGIVLRQPVYELDRMITVQPGAMLTLDAELLHSFPVGYRHLAYLQTQMGFVVGKSLPGTRGTEIAALSERMRRWLGGDNSSCLQS